MDPSVKECLSAALVSDILDDIGYDRQLLPVEIKPNYVEAKIVGRARTLKLITITEHDDYRQIYAGLPFIERMKDGEILVASGGPRDCAFFGELMSTLSQVCGIEGAIIDGFTRDTAQTRAMRFPVFARDNYARDIKRRGIIDGTDVPIAVGGVGITKGDLIVGDCDGVIVIPKTVEKAVLRKSLSASRIERRIKRELREGVPVTSIISKHGDF